MERPQVRTPAKRSWFFVTAVLLMSAWLHFIHFKNEAVEVQRSWQLTKATELVNSRGGALYQGSRILRVLGWAQWQDLLGFTGYTVFLSRHKNTKPTCSDGSFVTVGRSRSYCGFEVDKGVNYTPCSWAKTLWVITPKPWRWGDGGGDNEDKVDGY